VGRGRRRGADAARSEPVGGARHSVGFRDKRGVATVELSERASKLLLEAVRDPAELILNLTGLEE
jgi:hypothetical protein